jgi:hypothetical protein
VLLEKAVDRAPEQRGCSCTAKIAERPYAANRRPNTSRTETGRNTAGNLVIDLLFFATAGFEAVDFQEIATAAAVVIEEAI